MSELRSNNLSTQNPGEGEARVSQQELDPVLDCLPIEHVGQADPLNPDYSKGFPHILYHGTKQPEFTFNDQVDHRSPVGKGGANVGPGIYLGTLGAAETFKGQDGNGAVVEFIPHAANLIDLRSEQAKEPLSEDFKAEYIDDFNLNGLDRVLEHFDDVEQTIVRDLWETISDKSEGGGYLTKKETHQKAVELNKDLSGITDFTIIHNLVREISSQFNTARAISELEGISIQEIFATYSGTSGVSRLQGMDLAFELEPMQDFLTTRGVDGVIMSQDLQGESGVAFWRMDNLADKETWERRLNNPIRRQGKSVLDAAEVEKPAGYNTELMGRLHLSAEQAQTIADKIKDKEEIAPKQQLDQLFQSIKDETYDSPLDLVLKLAKASPELSALMSASTGTHEGYRLHEHTQAVIGQFEKEFKHKFKDKRDHKIITMALLLQDIGKPLAVARKGTKAHQAKFNHAVTRNILRHVDEAIVSAEEKKLITALVSQDVIGQHLQGIVDMEVSKDRISKMKNFLDGIIEPRKLEIYLQAMNLSDSSAYTAEASYTEANGTTKHAKPSLEHLFRRTAAGALVWSPENAQEVKQILGQPQN